MQDTKRQEEYAEDLTVQRVENCLSLLEDSIIQIRKKQKGDNVGPENASYDILNSGADKNEIDKVISEIHACTNAILKVQQKGAQKHDDSTERRFEATYLFRKKLAKTVFLTRKSYGWSQEQLAMRSGLDRSTIAKIEGMQRNASVGAMIALLAALDIDIDFTPREGSGILCERNSEHI